MPSSLPHSLPLEVLERIFKLAFLSDFPLTINSSSRVTPPPGTHNFLLVSHAIRSFCLPLFFRSITILRSQDWISFFDAEHGLFVAGGGQEAQDRWNMVQELALFVEADPPCRAGDAILEREKDVCLHSLIIPTRRTQLPKLIVLDTVPRQALKGDSEDGPGGDLRFTSSTLASPLGLPALKARLDNEWRMGNREYDREEHINEEVREHIGRRLRLERGQIIKTLLQNAYPLNIISSFSAWQNTLTSFPQYTIEWVDYVVLPPRSTEDELEDADDNDNDSSFLAPTIHLLWRSRDPFGDFFIGRGTIIQYVNSLKEVHKFIPGASISPFRSLKISRRRWMRSGTTRCGSLTRGMRGSLVGYGGGRPRRDKGSFMSSLRRRRRRRASRRRGRSFLVSQNVSPLEVLQAPRLRGSPRTTTASDGVHFSVSKDNAQTNASDERVQIHGKPDNMLSHLILPVAWIVLSRTARAQATIDTPSSLVTCQPTLLHWENGIAPYYLTVIPGNEPAAAPLKTFGELDGTQITWVVDLDPGTSVTIALKDSTGALSYTAAVTILAGKDSSCVDSSTGTANQIKNADASPSSAPSESLDAETVVTSTVSEVLVSTVSASDAEPTSSTTAAASDPLRTDSAQAALASLSTSARTSSSAHSISSILSSVTATSSRPSAAAQSTTAASGAEQRLEKGAWGLAVGLMTVTMLGLGL